MTYSEAIIKRIMFFCAEKNITVNKLATLSGMTQSTLDNIIKGHTKNPSLKTLHRLSQGLEIKLSEFLDFAELNEIAFDDE